MKPLTLLLLSIVFIAEACTPVQANEGEGIVAIPESTLEPSAPTPIPLISPTTTVEPPGEPIVFGPETNIVSRRGELSENEGKEFVMSAAASQSLYVQTVGFGAPVSFTIRGPNGDRWSGEPLAGEGNIFTAQVVLPQNGDYVVTLATLPKGGTTRYEVVFTILSGPRSTFTVPIESPERVEFASESFSSQRTSLLPSGLALKQYVLAGEADQTMTVGLTSDDVPISLSITSPSGIQYFVETFQMDAGYRASYTFTAVETGDYIVTLTKVEKTPSTNYTADFSIK